VEGGPLITVYQSGKYIISGCSSFQELETTNEKFISKIADLRICARSIDTGFTVQNVVCTEELSSAVDLNTLSVGLGLETVEYEPEQFRDSYTTRPRSEQSYSYLQTARS